MYHKKLDKNSKFIKYTVGIIAVFFFLVMIYIVLDNQKEDSNGSDIVNVVKNRDLYDTYKASIDANMYQSIEQEASFDDTTVYIKNMIVDVNAVVIEVDWLGGDMIGLDLVLNGVPSDQWYMSNSQSASSDYLFTYFFERSLQDGDILSVASHNQDETIAITVDGSKISQPQTLILDEQIDYDFATLYLEKLEVGGIVTTLYYKVDTPDNYLFTNLSIVLDTKESEKIGTQAYQSRGHGQNDNAVFYAGQLLDDTITSVQVTGIAFLSMEHQSLTYNPKTDKFSYLPESIEYAGIMQYSERAIFSFIDHGQIDGQPMIGYDGKQGNPIRVNEREFYVAVDKETYENAVNTDDLIIFYNSIPDLMSDKVTVVNVKDTVHDE